MLKAFLVDFGRSSDLAHKRDDLRYMRNNGLCIWRELSMQWQELTGILERVEDRGVRLQNARSQLVRRIDGVVVLGLHD